MRRYFCTGATGFIGREIVRQLLKREDTERIVCLTREIRSTHIVHPKVEYWVGDIVSVKFPQEPFTDLIHGANEANDLLQPDQMRYYYTIVEGTNRVLKWASTTGIDRTLLMSSGAIARDTIYGHAKRQSEFLCRAYGLNAKIARIYAVLGPEMPLNGQFAAGRFVGMALTEKRVRYYGGESTRTYIDITDCARWLLEILDNGPHIPVDVAGNEQITVEELAMRVGGEFNVPVVKIEGPDRVDNYLPDLTVANRLGLKQTLDIYQSLEAIREYHKNILAVRNPNMEPTP